MNIEQLAHDLELPVATFVELSELFLSTSMVSLDRLKNGRQNGTTTEIAAAAHEIKGAAINLGFIRIATLSGFIEENAAGDSIAIADWETKLIAAIDEIKRCIDATEGEG